MTERSLKQAKILDVNINSTSYDGVLTYVQKKLLEEKESEKFYIVTPNPEQVLIAQNDPLFKDILNEAEISIPDGIGIVAAIKYQSLPRPNKILKRLFVLLKQGVQVGLAVMFDQKWLQSEVSLIKGRKLFDELIIQCNENSRSVVLVGDDKKSAQKTALRLREIYPDLSVHALTGPAVDINGNPKRGGQKKEQKVINFINRVKPTFLFIGFGAPKQEKWLYRLYSKLDFKCAMVVGGTFDYVNGARKPVPKWIEDFNFEWIYRLLTGSQKPGRIFAAFPEFPLRIFLNKLVNK